MITITRFGPKVERPCFVCTNKCVVDVGFIPFLPATLPVKARPKYLGICKECAYELRDRAVSAINAIEEEEA